MKSRQSFAVYDKSGVLVSGASTLVPVYQRLLIWERHSPETEKKKNCVGDEAFKPVKEYMLFEAHVKKGALSASDFTCIDAAHSLFRTASVLI